MKHKHTSGPWKHALAFINNDPCRAIVSVDEWGGKTIADCGESDYGDEREANARLIAAAPEMLEALEEIAGDSRVDLVNSERRIRLYHLIEKAGGQI